MDVIRLHFRTFLQKCGDNNTVDLGVKFFMTMACKEFVFFYSKCSSATLIIHEWKMNKHELIIRNSVVSSVFLVKF